MHDVALGAGQADAFQTRSSSFRTRVKDVLARAVPLCGSVANFRVETMGGELTLLVG
jgi:hypothetical protein